MKVIQAHQHYRIRGGEDAMVEATIAALEHRGVAVCRLTSDSRAIGYGLWPRVAACASGIYSPAAGRTMRELIGRECPDLVHVHNLHPSLSPAVIVASRHAGVPVVMTCHNYRLVCPAGMLMRAGRVCERCLGGREYWCALTNCKGGLGDSLGYAARAIVHRWGRFYLDGVSHFIAVSEFVRRRLVEAGLPGERVSVVPNMGRIPETVTDCGTGQYIAFAGRFSPQKGVSTLLEAARRTGLPVWLAGDASPMPEVMALVAQDPDYHRVRLLGALNHEAMQAFFQGARLVVAPSECLEPFGLVAVEAMAQGRPVIAARSGGLAEIVQDGVTGVLFEPGNVDELASRMKALWDDLEQCRQLGLAGRARAMAEYSEERYVERLMKLYRETIKNEFNKS